MSRIFLDRELDTVASWWRIHRRDGVTLGFVTHDRDLVFDDIRHRAAPGMVPSAIRKTTGFEDDESEVEGALSAAAISARDLALGRFDGARVESGVVDWQTREAALLYSGTIGSVTQDGEAFAARLRSTKAALDVDPVPLSSPLCRAVFCGPGCTLPPRRFEHETTVVAVDADLARLRLAPDIAATLAGGEVLFLDGPQIGIRLPVIFADGDWLVLGGPLGDDVGPGSRVRVREGCDRTITTCATRFDNARNFRGEPNLPGNDRLAAYPVPR